MRIMLTLVLAGLVGTAMPGGQSRTAAERAYDQAVYVEEVEGDRIRAIEMYRTVLEQFGSDAAIAERARQRLATARNAPTQSAPAQAAMGHGIYIARYDQRAGRVVGPATPINGSSPDDSCAPSWSPDGRSIAFKRPSEAGADGRRQFFWVVRSPATGAEKATTFAVTAPLCWAGPVWFHDSRGFLNGSFIEWVDRPYRVDVDTMRATDVEVEHRKPAIALAPDDRTLYVTTHDAERRRTSIVAVDLASGSRRHVWTFPVDVESQILVPLRLAMSPDARTLALVLSVALPDGGTRSHLVRVGVDGLGHQLLHSAEGSGAGGAALSRSGLAWTRDGRSLLFMDAGPSGQRLMRIPASGGTPEFTGLTIGNANLDVIFDLSPDGQRIAFHSAGSFSIEATAR